MSYKDLFHSKKLLELLDKGELIHVLDKFRHIICKENLIGAGGDASCFGYKGDKKVLKICLKRIGYFENYGFIDNELGLTQVQQFQQHINSLKDFFVKIDKILYEDENVFVYTQKKCESLKKYRISPRIVISVIQMIQFMIKKNVLLTDISPHNLGLLNGKIKIFDYHGLQALKSGDGSLKKRKWCGRLLKNLTRYMTAIYAPEKNNKYMSYFDYLNVNNQIINELENDGKLPNVYLKFMKYVCFKDEINVDTLFEYLQNCVLSILEEFHFKRDELIAIDCLCNECVNVYDNDKGNCDDDWK